MILSSAARILPRRSTLLGWEPRVALADGLKETIKILSNAAVTDFTD